MMRIGSLLVCIILIAASGAIEQTRVAAQPMQALDPDILAQCKQQVEKIRPCHYADDVDQSIFALPFVRFLGNSWQDLGKYLKPEFDPDAGLDAASMQELVERWGAAEKRFSNRFTYQDIHFKKMAALCPPHQGNVQYQDVELLNGWLVRNGPLPKVPDPGSRLSNEQLLQVAPNANSKLLQLLNIVQGDPIGRKLIHAALGRGVQIYVQPLSEIQAFYNPETKKLVLDNSVLESEWKIHVLVHELVHTANERPINSFVEEAVAQIIGSGVQDRITGIPLACHPYYVFADRLLRYDGLQVISNIQECLGEIGIDCTPNALPACREPSTTKKNK